jgi:hypothetical protein
MTFVQLRILFIVEINWLSKLNLQGNTAPWPTQVIRANLGAALLAAPITKRHQGNIPADSPDLSYPGGLQQLSLTTSLPFN